MIREGAPARLANAQQAIDAELTTVAVTPAGLNAFYRDRFGVIPVRAPEASVGDGTQALLDAVEVARAAGGGLLTFSQKEVYIKPGVVTLDFGNVMFESARGTKLIANPPPPYGAGTLTEDTLIAVAGTGPGVSTTLSTSITDPRSTFDIEVADSSAFAQGDIILLYSTVDYFYGVADQSGFRTSWNSEMVKVREVTTGHLKLAQALRYTYTSPGTTVFKMGMVSNVRFAGLFGQGLGYGPAGIWDSAGPGFISVDNCDGVTLKDVSATGFGSWAFLGTNCLDTHIKGGKVIGLDYSDPNLTAGQSTQSYGAWWFGGCQNMYLQDLYAENVRMVTDMNSNAGGPVCFNQVCVDVRTDGFSTSTALGGHIGDVQIFIGCNTQRGGIYTRAKNWAVIGCNINVSADSDGVTTSDNVNGLASGSGSSADPYAENPDMGFIRVIGNDISGAIPFELRNACSGAEITGNRFNGLTHGCYFSGGKFFTNFNFSGNLFDLSRRSGTRYGVYFDSDADTPLQTLTGITSYGDTFKNVSSCFALKGTNSQSTPANQIVLRNMTMVGTLYTPSSAVRLTGGFFGDDVRVKGVTVVGTVPTSSIDLDPEPGYYSRRPEFSGYSVYDPRNIGYGALLPTTAGQTVSVGDTFQIIAGALRTCTVAGTIGTLAGVTGTITNGSPNLTVIGAASFDVMPGMYLSITGAGPAAAALVARVVSCTFTGTFVATACVLDTNAGTSVTGNAVAYRNPTIP